MFFFVAGILLVSQGQASAFSLLGSRRSQALDSAAATVAIEEAERRKRRKNKVTSSPWVDVEARKVLKLVFHEFVDNWYVSVTDNKELRSNMEAMVVKMLEGLETRVDNFDLVPIVMKDLPFIVSRFVRDQRLAKERAGTVLGGEYTADELFSRIQPHFALKSPETEKVFITAILYSLSPDPFATSGLILCD